MNDIKWMVLDETAGNTTAELIRSYLEAHEIPVMLSQEGVGHFGYPVNVGRIGRVQILIPIVNLEQAKQLLEDFRSTTDIEGEDIAEKKEMEDEA